VRVPTGVAIQDAQLFAAAERVLLRGGPNGLTSRAVTTEAGCAKGVLHRHFADFDAFLAALVRDRGRLPPDADVAVLAPTLVGAAHLLFAGGGDPATLHDTVVAVLP
jgi:AcrR family transcriptional regulator